MKALEGAIVISGLVVGNHFTRVTTQRMHIGIKTKIYFYLVCPANMNRYKIQDMPIFKLIM